MSLSQKKALKPIRSYILYLLSKKSYPFKILKEKLLQKGYPETEIEKSLKFFIKNNLINDKEYFNIYIQNLFEKCYGKNKIIALLKRQGIDPLILKEFEKTLLVKESEKARLEKIIAERKFKDNEHMIKYLYNKGFDYIVIKEVIKIFNEEEKYQEE